MINYEKYKLLRNEQEWFDPDNEKDEMEVSSKLIKVTSSASLSGLSHNGKFTHTAYRLVIFSMLYFLDMHRSTYGKPNTSSKQQ